MTKKNKHQGASEDSGAPENKTEDACGQASAAAAPAEEEKCRLEAVADSPENARAEADSQRKLAAEYLDHLQRLQAEFDNFRRRSAKERADTIRYANEQLLLKLLPLLDNLQRGLAFAEKGASADDIVKGFRMVEREFESLLSDFGVAPFASLNEKFDPSMHDAKYAMERPDLSEDTVIEEIRKGYQMHDRVIRAAEVVVGKPPLPPEPEETQSDGGS